jgi:hypothetical protein
MGDEDIIKSKRFNTQLLDILEFFQPNGGSPCPPGKHIGEIFLALFLPGIAVNTAYLGAHPDDKCGAIMYAISSELLHKAWIVLQIAEVEFPGMHTLGWLCFTAFFCIVAFARVEIRNKYNIWGSPADDGFVALFAYPFVLAQMKMHVDTDGLDAPTYFKSADEMIATMKVLAEGGTATADVKFTETVSAAKSEA